MPISDANTAAKVLLVDDDEDNAIITEALLKQSSVPRFEIDWVDSFDAGLSRLKEHHHDISLLDYNLGSKTGLNFLRAAQSDSLQAPIIMLTGQGNESLALEALESGAIDYIPKRNISSENLQQAIGGAAFFEKPYDFDYLLAALRTSIEHPNVSLFL